MSDHAVQEAHVAREAIHSALHDALHAVGSDVLSQWQRQHASVAPFDSLLLVSVSDGYARAQVTTLTVDVSALRAGQWEVLVPALEQAITRLQRKFGHPLVGCRIEWPFAVREGRWGAFKQELKRYKRSYFRSGLAFEGKREARLLLSEMELNANACLYGGHQVGHAQINQAHLERYLKARHGSSQMPSFADEMPMWSFATAGVFLALGGEQPSHHLLSTQPRCWGRRETPPLTPASTAELIARSTRFLGRQVQANGRYVYGYFPCFNRDIGTYNILRHASSTYALLEGYESCLTQRLLDDEQLRQLHGQIDRALESLRDRDIIERDGAAYVVDTGNIIKLGANAVAILALVKYQQVMDDDRYAALADALALGIVRMQEADGSFVHVLNAADLSLKEKSRIIYYDGEAAFALMRLYGQTRNPQWLACVVKAFDYFIDNGHEQAHDHWLAYCTNELVMYRPERRYFEFAVRNVAGYIDFIRDRITTFPTLLELSMAFHKTLLTLEQMPELADVLDGLDIDAFYHALHTRANYLQNGFFWPEVAMYFKAPYTVQDGFFIRHHSFRVRIDDVEHYLSGLVAYQQLLGHGRQASFRVDGGKLEAESLASTTSGRWHVMPPMGWQATGLCCKQAFFASGHLVVASGRADTGFLTEAAIKALVEQGASAVICEQGEVYQALGVPILQVEDVQAAVLAIGQHQRRQFRGRVVGVTGSAGKTTVVAMLAHALDDGPVGQSRGSANLPIGVAWNMASMPQTANYWAVEMAIGSMAVNTALARPDLAIITNIAASHLVYHHSLDEIARKKARIFRSMAPGGVAILYRDSAHYGYLAGQARHYRLTVISFGEHEEADVRLLEYHGLSGQVCIDGNAYTVELAAAGRHMMLNALAILAVAQHDRLPLAKVIERLRTFQAVPGRGEVKQLNYQGVPITLHDEAYNANPLSMRMALEAFAALPVKGENKLLIIGDMLELGEEAEALHRELSPLIAALATRRVLLCGPLSQPLLAMLGGEDQGVFHYSDVKALKPELMQHLQPGDHVLVKASHGVGLASLFAAPNLVG
ncbi:UDP-N-acetylmuramoyl-tripeptide--D-alanyl-D-alanine ligase [Halomonas sp. BC1]|uniref:UDP-N-acetylmuramoyl-tripeptide--D-alanyl-D- alanine ligase n=1 Tax=Halomonas sp. BC1 TaxID=1670448 RepID=UPI0009BEE330|nr:UDP-N-acetylmuramoyl-tripeptide--D-alanyl-D-alanine ligase [Halomonas sp. BC1]